MGLRTSHLWLRLIQVRVATVVAPTSLVSYGGCSDVEPADGIVSLSGLRELLKLSHGTVGSPTNAGCLLYCHCKLHRHLHRRHISSEAVSAPLLCCAHRQRKGDLSCDRRVSCRSSDNTRIPPDCGMDELIWFAGGLLASQVYRIEVGRTSRCDVGKLVAGLRHQGLSTARRLSSSVKSSLKTFSAEERRTARVLDLMVLWM